MPEWLGWMWEAFWELDSDRAIGMAEGDIPFTAIDRFAARYGVHDQDEFEFFRSVIRNLDREYRAHRSRKPSADGSTPVSLDNAGEVKSMLKELSAGWEARERKLLAQKQRMRAEAKDDGE